MTLDGNGIMATSIAWYTVKPSIALTPRIKGRRSMSQLSRYRTVAGTVFAVLLAGHSMAHAQGFSAVQSPQGIHGVPNSSGYGGSGQCVADFDGDGDVDVIMATPNGYPYRYFRNDGGLMFTDLTASCGMGLCFEALVMCAGDIDNDGDQDIFVGQVFGPMQLFINSGNGTFTEEAAVRGLTQADESWGAAFGDYDRDGLLDLYVGNRYLVGSSSLSNPNYLYRNVGNGHFVDVTASAGMVGGVGATLITAFFDYNEDNWPDLIEINDKASIGGAPNEVFRNNGDGTFTAVGAAINANNAIWGMAFDFVDVFNDGGVDYYCSDIPIDHLFQHWNPATNKYVDDTLTYGLQGLGFGWAANFLDYDNDGWQDLHQVHEYLPNSMMRNPAAPAGAQVTWADYASSLGLDSFDLQFVTTVGDFDDDGRMDLLERFAEGPPWVASPVGVKLMHNTVAGGNWLKIRAEGTVSNRDGLGARIEVITGTHRQRQWVRSGTGWMSTADRRVHFGLGSAATVDKITIRWPSGQVQHLTGVAVNQILHVVEPSMRLAAPAQVGSSTSLDVNIQGDEGLQYMMLLALSNAPATVLSDGTSIPLAIDAITILSTVPGNPVQPLAVGSLDGNGHVSSPLNIPPLPFLLGLTIYGTALTIDQNNFTLVRTSFPSAVPITIQ